MTRFRFTAILAAMAAGAGAQPKSTGDKMGLSSTMVVGAVSDGQHFNPATRAGGFFIDSRHVVSNLLDCCGKTDKGEQLIPVVLWGKGDSSQAKVIWSSQDTEIAILELDKPMNHPGVTIAPSKLVTQGEDVYSVQYPSLGQSQMASGKLTGTAAVGDKKIALFKSNLQMSGGNSGGALFDACGNAIGINLTMKDGSQYAFVIDPLIDALSAAGVQATVADQPCSGAGGGGGSGGAQGGATQGGSNGGGGDSGKEGQGKEKDGKGKEGGAEEPGSGLRWPTGAEWIPVGIVLGLLVLAFRPARKQVVQAITGRHKIPGSAPYPGAAPAYPQASSPLAGGTMPYPPGTAPPLTPMGVGHPVLKGISGQYAGSAFTLDAYGNTLGRDPAAANLVFSGDAASVSKRHCTVRWDAGRGLFLLEDHGSTNGTFLASGERLAPNQPRELRPGDRFYIGDLRNQFEVTMEP